MHVSLTAAEFLPLARAADSVAPKSDPRPVLRNVLLEAVDGRLEVKATDTNGSIWLSLSEVEVHEEGQALVRAKRLLDVVRANKGHHLDLKMTKKGLRVTCKKQRAFSLITEDPNDFPSLTFIAKTLPITKVPAGRLLKLIKRVGSAAHDEDSRFLMHGLNVELRKQRLRFVATDGLHLSLASIPLPDLPDDVDVQAVIRAKDVDAFRWVVDDEDEVEIQLAAHNISLRGSRGVATVRRLAGNFAPYERGVPSPAQTPHQIEFERKPLLDVLDQVLLLKDTAPPAMRLRFNEEGLLISARVDNDLFAERVAAEWPGEEETDLFYNSKIVRDAIKAMEADKVRIECHSTRFPTIFRELAEDYAHFIVMAPLASADVD